MKHAKCEGKTSEDCYECNMYSSRHSLHYSKVYKEDVIEITCSIGGSRAFNKTGKEIRYPKS